ncbi:hypothetical protein [Rubritalea profundi]|uniref:hypothetical protein n=1 Tax=Rubritalea profundi TaxID=1658618 RepID=UPI0013FE4564|nr:hypothetical protein [Rubritalea profundi]
MNLDSIITDYLTSHWQILTLAGLFILTLKICRLPNIKGWFGEKVVERGLKKLNPE